jgi:hypothetical protein
MSRAGPTMRRQIVDAHPTVPLRELVAQRAEQLTLSLLATADPGLGIGIPHWSAPICSMTALIACSAVMNRSGLLIGRSFLGAGGRSSMDAPRRSPISRTGVSRPGETCPGLRLAIYQPTAEGRKRSHAASVCLSRRAASEMTCSMKAGGLVGEASCRWVRPRNTNRTRNAAVET